MVRSYEQDELTMSETLAAGHSVRGRLILIFILCRSIRVGGGIVVPREIEDRRMHAPEGCLVVTGAAYTTV
jgi:hypothetical protein